MKRILIVVGISLTLFQLNLCAQTIEKIAPGVRKITYEIPEDFKPSDFKELPALESMKILSNSETPPISKGTEQYKKKLIIN